MRHACLWLVVVLLSMSTMAHAEDEIDHQGCVAVKSAINVRSGPGSQYPVIDSIPYDPSGTMVLLNHAQGEWMHIYEVDLVGKVRKCQGWIYGPLLSIEIYQDKARLYQHPDRGSRILGFVPRGHLRFPGARVYGYDRGWMLVEPFAGEGPAVRGWIVPGIHCGQPWTTCESLGGNVKP